MSGMARLLADLRTSVAKARADRGLPGGDDQQHRPWYWPATAEEAQEWRGEDRADQRKDDPW